MENETGTVLTKRFLFQYHKTAVLWY